MKWIIILNALLVPFAAALAAGGGDAHGELKAGFAQTDITPPVGAIITGPAGPISTGTDDPLRARAMVVQSGNRKLAIVGVDLVKVTRALADQTIALVTQRTDITRDAVLICPSHNHSGPLIPAQGGKVTANKAYIATLPQRISDSIVQANEALQPVRMSVGRSLVYEGHINRRVISKADGLALNTWLKKLNDLRQVPQVLGSEGVTDPELWLVRFDSPDGKMFGSLVNFTCHPCLHDRIKIHTWSADFPGVIAEHIAQAFGPQAVCVFTQGASGNIQPPVTWTPDWKERSAVFAKAAVDAAKEALPVEDRVVVDYARRDVDVPRCNAEAQRPEAITRLGWRPESFEGAKRTAAAMPRTLNVPVSVARIGPFAIATNPGELFVEWGISVKKRSPFPHTILGELTNDWVGYEPTELAFQHEGYETLAGANFVSLEGIQKLVDASVDLLQELWKKDGGKSTASPTPKP
ncbi:MAG: neutral/alkaline non-lysosomal ceramidase N-terminal domain-containing protein [Verrucomicrobiaceae bacterium]|nr:neutral/alkaline non-lysosomal ceramidase N-terminal domain-containing protein [Verrucomicrobiaceae bacterium]